MLAEIAERRHYLGLASADGKLRAYLNGDASSVPVQDLDFVLCRLVAAAQSPLRALGDKGAGFGHDDVDERLKRQGLRLRVPRQGAERIVDDDCPLRASDDEPYAELAQDLRQDSAPRRLITMVRRLGGHDPGAWSRRENDSDWMTAIKAALFVTRW